jgi:hypothetical protein
MANISLNNVNSPAPKKWRRFENAYFAALAPVIAATISGWGLADAVANKALLVLSFVGGLIKFVGMFLADEEPAA